MLQHACAPFRLWGHGNSLQAMLLSRKGLVIRNGAERVLIPEDSIGEFLRQLESLIEQNSLSGN